MKLSEAIRLGSMNRPQAFHYLCDPDTGGTCALGAAADAIGILNHQTSRYSGHAPDAWKPIARHRTKCPCGCGWPDEQVQVLMIHLNNEARWTREQIAAWVEGIEQADERRAVAGGQPQTETLSTPVRLVP